MVIVLAFVNFVPLNTTTIVRQRVLPRAGTEKEISLLKMDKINNQWICCNLVYTFDHFLITTNACN